MSLILNRGSAGINLVANKAKTGVAVAPNRVFFHLTQGFDLSSVNGQGRLPEPAFSAVGHVKVTPSGSKPTQGWQFGFVQLTKMLAGQAFYAGRTTREGSIAVLFERGMPAQLLLDSLPAQSPWTRSAPQFELVRAEIDCGTEDHPVLVVPRDLRNTGRNVDNFLFHVVDRRLFWTVLTAIEPGGKRHHLAHFHWEVSHNVTFKWRNSQPEIRESKSAFTSHRNVKGAPTESELTALLEKPEGPFFNPEAEKAMLQAFLGPRGPNRTENERWFANVPLDFYS